MDMEDIKNLEEGQVVYLQNYPVTFKRMSMAGVVVNDDVAEASHGNMCYFPAKYLESVCFHPENVTKNTETAPKYDPCRKFRKGDLVRLKAYNGRKPYDFWHKQTIEHFGAKLDTVLADELDSGNVDIFQDAPIDELTVRVHASHLELVTPVEELEPYFIEEGGNGYRLMKRNGKLLANYWETHPQAKAAAEAECARLNAEYRKEQE